MKYLMLLLLTAIPVSAAELPLELDAKQSRVDIVVESTIDSFVGSLGAYDASILVDPAKSEITRARFSFHFIDVKTGKADRDTSMHAWQNTPANPDGVFVLDSLSLAEDRSRIAKGKLTFHGQTRDLTFPVTVTHDLTHFAIDGDALIDTRDFGLPVIKKMLVLKVDPEVHVRFHLQGTAGPAKK